MVEVAGRSAAERSAACMVDALARSDLQAPLHAWPTEAPPRAARTSCGCSHHAATMHACTHSSRRRRQEETSEKRGAYKRTFSEKKRDLTAFCSQLEVKVAAGGRAHMQ